MPVKAKMRVCPRIGWLGNRGPFGPAVKIAPPPLCQDGSYLEFVATFTPWYWFAGVQFELPCAATLAEAEGQVVLYYASLYQPDGSCLLALLAVDEEYAEAGRLDASYTFVIIKGEPQVVADWAYAGYHVVHRFDGIRTATYGDLEPDINIAPFGDLLEDPQAVGAMEVVGAWDSDVTANELNGLAGGDIDMTLHWDWDVKASLIGDVIAKSSGYLQTEIAWNFPWFDFITVATQVEYILQSGGDPGEIIEDFVTTFTYEGSLDGQSLEPVVADLRILISDLDLSGPCEMIASTIGTTANVLYNTLAEAVNAVDLEQAPGLVPPLPITLAEACSILADFINAFEGGRLVALCESYAGME